MKNEKLSKTGDKANVFLRIKKWLKEPDERFDISDKESEKRGFILYAYLFAFMTLIFLSPITFLFIDAELYIYSVIIWMIVSIIFCEYKWSLPYKRKQ